MRLRLEQVVGERDRRIELEAVGLSAERLSDRIHRGSGCSGPFEQRASIQVIGHQDLFDRAPCLRDSP
jgi:hypothetical protein